MIELRLDFLFCTLLSGSLESVCFSFSPSFLSFFFGCERSHTTTLLIHGNFFFCQACYTLPCDGWRWVEVVDVFWCVEPSQAQQHMEKQRSVSLLAVVVCVKRKFWRFSHGGSAWWRVGGGWEKQTTTTTKKHYDVFSSNLLDWWRRQLTTSPLISIVSVTTSLAGQHQVLQDRPELLSADGNLMIPLSLCYRAGRERQICRQTPPQPSSLPRKTSWQCRTAACRRWQSPCLPPSCLGRPGWTRAGKSSPGPEGSSGTHWCKTRYPENKRKKSWSLFECYSIILCSLPCSMFLVLVLREKKRS